MSITWQRVEHFECGGNLIFDKVVELGLEGIVSKRRQAPYRRGKNSDWLKTKNKQLVPYVIGGFEVGGSDIGFDLLLGYHDNGRLVYAGRAGLGFTRKHRAELRRSLEAVLTDSCPFAAWSGRKVGIRWVEPSLVGVIAQGAWKGAGRLREAVYRGLRDDIEAGQVAVE